MATIPGVYLALFERPADPRGLEFFNGVTRNGADLSGIGDLAGQREYLDRFVGQSNTQIVQSIYRSLFNREGEQAGVDFFVGRLQRGEIGINQIAINILDGARGSDLTTLNNKLSASFNFTFELTTPDEIANYSGDFAAAAGRAFLAGVTTTVPNEAATIAAVARATGPGGPGTTVVTGDGGGTTLVGTAGLDRISTGGRGNETTNGDVVRPLGGFDEIVTAASDSTPAVPNAAVANGAGFTAAELARFTTFEGIEFGGAPGNVVDRLNLAATFDFAGPAQIVGGTSTTAAFGPRPLVGATFGAAVDAALADAGALRNAGASGAGLKAGLFGYNGETFLIASEAASGAGYTAGDVLVVRLTGVAGTLSASDLLLA